MDRTFLTTTASIKVWVLGICLHIYSPYLIFIAHSFVISSFVFDDLVLTIPNLHQKEISVDLLSRILKQAGITRNEWLKKEWSSLDHKITLRSKLSSFMRFEVTVSAPHLSVSSPLRPQLIYFDHHKTLTHHSLAMDPADFLTEIFDIIHSDL